MTEVLFLVRHGEVEGWRPGLLLGSSDAPLSEAGRRQAALVRDMIPTDAERFVCSPLARTRETADIVVAGRDVVVETQADLREIGFGEWEGLTHDEVAKDYPLLIKGWSEFRPDFAFPQGESLEDFGRRIERVAQSLAEAATATVVAITHGGVIRSLVCHFLGLPLRDYLLFDVAPGSVTTLRLWDGRGVLTGLCSPDAMAHSGRPRT